MLWAHCVQNRQKQQQKRIKIRYARTVRTVTVKCINATGVANRLSQWLFAIILCVRGDNFLSS